MNATLYLLLMFFAGFISASTYHALFATLNQRIESKATCRTISAILSVAVFGIFIDLIFFISGVPLK